MKLDNFFASGWRVEELQRELKHRYEIVNIIIISSLVGLAYGIIGNIIRDAKDFIELELLLFLGGLIMVIYLRKSQKYLKPISNILSVEYAFFFLFLVYNADPNDMKHLWIFAYPIILLNLQTSKKSIYCLVCVVFFLLIAPVQNLVEVHFSLYQVSYMAIVFIIVSVIIYFYQTEIDEARELILNQQDMLKLNNEELASQIEELKYKDKLLTAQSKQAVMGEMISMIAHQWRQPLSNITLQISNYQFKQLFFKGEEEREIDKTLCEISDAIIYLSDTIDDFQTYFRPNKELSEIEIHELIQRAVNFALPRVKESNVDLVIQKTDETIVHTYVNEIIQVILNILNNAIDALTEIKEKTPNIIVSFEHKTESVVVQIKDNANGIADEYIERLFEPYFSTKGKNGTGLGLYMSQMIMQKQFGTKILVQTSANGSTFTIEIPRNLH
ncbi:MAG: signal transduction histidine kinase [Sulfurimonas sp.]|jgi:signal transduction histidine kinase